MPGRLATSQRRRLVINFYLAALVLCSPSRDMTVLHHACTDACPCFPAFTITGGLLGASVFEFCLSDFQCVWAPRQWAYARLLFQCVYLHIYVHIYGIHVCLNILLLQLRVCFGCALCCNFSGFDCRIRYYFQVFNS